ncbi:MAG: hypothetical protein ACJ8GK_05110 [Luteimonas sp.]
MSAAAAATAAMARRQRQLVAVFSAAGAIDAAHARTPEELALGDRLRALQQLRDRNVIRMAAPGRFWVDLVAWQAFRRRRRRLALVLVLVALTLGLVALVPLMR